MTKTATTPPEIAAKDAADGVSAVHEEAEEQAVEEATGLSPRLIYEVVRREGEEELARPLRALAYSGVAAGIMISFSVLGEAILRTYLPDAPWRHLVENLGYSLGFLLVIIGRMQLFTENVITTVLPLMARPTLRIVGQVARLWALVLGANVLGAFFIAFVWAYTPAIPAEYHPAILSLSEHATTMPPWQGFARGIPAGILIAAIVWMQPGGHEGRFFIILTFTWLIAAGDFTHIVAGSVEMAYMIWTGHMGAGGAIFGFFLPVLAGNIVGGTVIFTLMAWGQVKDEVLRERKRRQERKHREWMERRRARKERAA